MREFLQAWLTWAEGDAEQCNPFHREYGLCSNVHAHNGYNPELIIELKALFTADGLDTDYPFGHYLDYDARADLYEQHLYEPRLAWVRSKLADSGQNSTQGQ